MKYTEFLGWVDTEKFAQACHNIAHQGILNESSNRMMKEKFILAALQLCNHKNNIEWVDARDFDIKFTDWQKPLVEVKTGNEPMFSVKTGKPKKNIKIKLKNVYESKNQRTSLDKEFDHLMIIQNTGTFAIAFVDYATVLKNIQAVTDGFLLNLTHNDIEIVYQKDMRQEDVTMTVNLDPKIWVISKLTEAGL